MVPLTVEAYRYISPEMKTMLDDSASIVDVLTNPITPCYVYSDSLEMIATNIGVSLRGSYLKTFIFEGKYAPYSYRIKYFKKNLVIEKLLGSSVPNNYGKQVGQKYFSEIKVNGNANDILEEFNDQGWRIISFEDDRDEWADSKKKDVFLREDNQNKYNKMEEFALEHKKKYLLFTNRILNNNKTKK